MSEMRVTLVASASQPVSEFQKLQSAAVQSAQSFAQVTRAANAGAKVASGSFQDLRTRLGQARSELDRLGDGTPEFLAQAEVVKQLSAAFAEAKQRIVSITVAEQGFATGTAQLKEQNQAATAAAGSFQKLRDELSVAIATMNGLDVGSEEFRQQAAVVGRLTSNVEVAKQKIAEIVQAEAGLANGTVALNQQSKAASAAAGSYQNLKAQLTEAEAVLNRLDVGSEEWKQQAAAVGKLTANIDSAKQKMSEIVQAEAALASGTASLGKKSEEAKAAANSYTRLRDELKAAEATLNTMDLNSTEWKQQAAVVANLSTNLDEAESQLRGLVQPANAAAGSLNALEKELKDNLEALRNLKSGSRAFDEQKAKVDALRKSVEGANRGIAQSGNSITEGLKSGVSQITSLAASMVGFQAIVTAVVSELEKAKQLKLEAADTTRTFEQALADIGQNIGADKIDEAKAIIVEQAPNLNVDQKGLGNLLGIAISAGAKDLKEATALVAASLKLTVGDANKAAALVGGTLDVASLGGSTNFEGALGQLLQTQAQVRSTNLAEFAANIGPGLAAATAKGQNTDGVTTERALEVASVVSQIIKDPTGSNTATTIRQFFGRLDSFTPEESKKLDDGGTATVSKEAIAQFNATRNFDEKIELFRKNEGLALQFLETQRESIGKTAVREIIIQSDRAKGFEDKAKANITSIDDGSDFFKALVSKVNQETVTLTAERKSQANLQQSEVTSGRGIEGQAVKILFDTLNKVDLSGIDYFRKGEATSILAKEAAQGKSQITTAIDVLTQLKGQTRALGIIPLGGSVSEKDRSTIDTQIRLLEQLRDKQQEDKAAANRLEQAMLRNNELLEQVVRNQQGGNVPPAVGRPAPLRPAPVARPAVVP
jgi:hypothetical protein